MNDDLRTDIAKLAVKYENLGNDEVSADAVWCDLINALVAHPAPERPAGAQAISPSAQRALMAQTDKLVAERLAQEAADAETMPVAEGLYVRNRPAPVSDTRREDVARAAKYQALRDHEPRHMGCACGAKFGDSIDARWHLANQVTAAILAALPAPPVVDEAALGDVVREHLALATLYVCTRDASAWGHGTMRLDDFAPAWEDEEVVADLVNLVRADALAARLRGATRG